MNIIQANAQYLDANGVHPYAFMEKAGRTCYKSEDNITDTSAVKFVSALMKNKHTAMLEHSHIIFEMNQAEARNMLATCTTLMSHRYSKNQIVPHLNITINDNNGDEGNYMSGSFRTFINLFDTTSDNIHIKHKFIQAALHNTYPELFEKPDDYDGDTGSYKILSRDEFKESVTKAYPAKTDSDAIIKKHLVHSVLFTCDRGVSHEFVRHRPASFAQESTRYCNYSKDKFGREITVIEPCFYEKDSDAYKAWYEGCLSDEKTYFKLLDAGCTAQQARDNLPTSVKTEIVITATEVEWQHIINLRYHGTTGAPHPQMKEVMAIIYDDLVKAADNRLK